LYNINWQRKARKQLGKIDRQHQNDIVDAIDSLQSFPNVKNVRPLTNHECQYRLRVGNYRVLFDADVEVKIVDIQQVKKRDDNTY